MKKEGCFYKEETSLFYLLFKRNILKTFCYVFEKIFFIICSGSFYPLW